MQKESMAKQMPVNELQFVLGLLSVPKALNVRSKMLLSGNGSESLSLKPHSAFLLL